MTQDWQSYLSENEARFMAEFLDLLRIPSISTNPEYKAEVRRAADWVKARMERAGLENVRLLETAGHPVVYGDWLNAPGRPTILIYGHFDVQPADPLELWESPPFEPQVKDGKIFARGASDMKGNLLFPIIACEALLKTEGKLPVNVKFLLEGEEESGSPSLRPTVTANKELFAADFCVSADSGQASETQPMIVAGLRGNCGFQIDLKTANMDLHSGFGGAAPNALHELVRLLNSLRNPDYSIAVEGFYENVAPITEEERALVADDSEVEAFKAHAGLKGLVGEPGFTPLERVGFRPTLEVNGMWGGYQGLGGKTVIPAEAHAKITCRLVPNQSPEEILGKVEAHIRKQTPPHVEVSISSRRGGSFPYRVPLDHPGLAALRRVYSAMYSKEPRYEYSGGTVPALGMLLRELGLQTVSLGFGLRDERIHSPNEFFRVSSFQKGMEAYCRLLQAVE